MARTKEQNERLRQATKDKIHMTAIECFSLNGFGSTTMQDLASAADISVGLLYRHYKSRDELFDALVDEAIFSHEQMIEKIESLPPIEAIKFLVNDIIDELSNGYGFSQFMDILLQKQGDKQRKANEKIIMAIASLIERGQSEGVFARGNPQQLSQLLIAIFQGLSSSQLILKEAFILPTTEQIISFLEVKNNG